MEERKINLRLVIKPENFGKDIEKLIKENSMNKDCTKEYGYIIKINKIINWNNMLSRNNGANIINALVQAQTFLPKIGLLMDSIVNMIFPQCIFAEYLNIKIVIPANSNELKDYVYENQIFKNDKNIIQIGDIIKIEILNIRYNNKKLSCIGKLKI